MVKAAMLKARAATIISRFASDKSLKATTSPAAARIKGRVRTRTIAKISTRNLDCLPASAKR